MPQQVCFLCDKYATSERVYMLPISCRAHNGSAFSLLGTEAYSRYGRFWNNSFSGNNASADGGKEVQVMHPS